MLVFSWGVGDALLVRQCICNNLILKGYFTDEPLTSIKNRLEVKLTGADIRHIVYSTVNGNVDPRIIDESGIYRSTTTLEDVYRALTEFCNKDTVYLTVPIILGVKNNVNYLGYKTLNIVLGSLGVTLKTDNTLTNHEDFKVFINGLENTDICTGCRLCTLKLNGMCLYYTDKLQCLLNTQKTVGPDLDARLLVSVNGHGVNIETPDELNGGIYYV